VKEALVVPDIEVENVAPSPNLTIFTELTLLMLPDSRPVTSLVATGVLPPAPPPQAEKIPANPNAATNINNPLFFILTSLHNKVRFNSNIIHFSNVMEVKQDLCQIHGAFR
jgi:hypothetical protein